MSTSDEGLVRLTIRAGDAATEIWVMDGQFRVQAHMLGMGEVSLAPGIYKVRATAGPQSWEELVALPPGRETEHLEIPTLRFASPVPLPDTALTHKYHELAASHESGQVHVTAGQGSAIFIFARYYTLPDTPATQLSGLHHPAQGLTLRDLRGNLVADLAAQSAAELSPPRDPWAACNVLVDPGLYRLRLELPTGSSVEQTLVAVSGWQTQAFALQRSYDSEPGAQRADLLRASILYSRYDREFGPWPPFDPTRSEYKEGVRLAELARLGLTNQRPVLRREVTDMVWMKYDNPMLGILGAHLLLLDKEPDYALFRTVVTNLRRILGIHPDVEALALRLDSDDRPYVFEVPPMLRRSWSLILEATVTRPDLVPLNTLASRMAEHLWGDGPWLLWTVPAEPDLASYIAVARREIATKKRQAPELGKYASVLAAQLSLAEPAPQAKGIVEPTSRGLSESTRPELDDDTARMLVDTLQVPRANVENMVDQLQKKTQLYESTRSKLPPGLKRTRELERVVAQVREIASAGEEGVSSAIGDLITTNTEGSRIAALGVLQAKPDPQFFPSVLGTIEGSKSAFEQYHALLAARAMIPLLNPDQKEQLVATLDDQRSGGEGKYITPDSDRWVVSTWMIDEVRRGQ
jgi:hypothetical protein